MSKIKHVLNYRWVKVCREQVAWVLVKTYPEMSDDDLIREVYRKKRSIWNSLDWWTETKKVPGNVYKASEKEVKTFAPGIDLTLGEQDD